MVGRPIPPPPNSGDWGAADPEYGDAVHEPAEVEPVHPKDYGRTPAKLWSHSPAPTLRMPEGPGRWVPGETEVETLPPLTEVQEAIRDECDALGNLLIAKNRQYGNSAIDPVRVFSTSDGEEQIRVRIDDKLSRLKRGLGDTEDTILDLIGYLVLLRVQRRLSK